MRAGSRRRELVRWGACFFLVVSALLALVGLRYLASYPWPAAPVARLYTVVAFTSHFAMLGMATWMLGVLPLTLLVPSRRLVVPAAVAVAAALLAVLLVDSLVFAENRFHLSALALTILGWQTFAFAALYFAIFLTLCGFLARWSAARFSRPLGRARVAVLVALLAVPFLTTQALHVWADARYYVPITGFTPYLPLFRPWIAKHLLARQVGLVDMNRSRDEAQMADLAAEHEGILRYPLSPLECKPPPEPLNVLLIGIDAMREDANNPRVAPNLFAFSSRAIQFKLHWSAGNGTRPGLFSLFYGLPPTYWKTFYAEQRSPVLLDQLQRHDYQLGIFPSNPPDRIVGMDRTIFRNVSDLPRTSGDVAVTQGWIEWLAAREPDRPFFGFLFYESPPGSCRAGYPQVSPVADDAAPEAKRRACYETAVHFADAQLGAVLSDLERRGLLDQTVVLVTSDHGEQFDESGLGFKGHGSAYSHEQLHTPMVVHWPGRPPGVVVRRTSHNDVAPTLLSRVLGCRNPAGDYSSGGDLFSDEGWSWLVAASYTGFAVVQPEQITISSGAYFEIRDPEYRLIEEPRLDRDVIARAVRETARFYRE